MSTKRRKPEYAFGLGHGFAKLLKANVGKSIKKHGLEQPKTPAWWPHLEEKKE